MIAKSNLFFSFFQLFCYPTFCSEIESEFAGQNWEFSGVSANRFNKENLKSAVYFLSHDQTDHVVGLNQPEFFERLKRYNLQIRCHKISANVLIGLPLYIHSIPCVMPVESEIEVILKFSTESDKTDTLTVKSIPALHFLGSVTSH